MEKSMPMDNLDFLIFNYIDEFIENDGVRFIPDDVMNMYPSLEDACRIWKYILHEMRYAFSEMLTSEDAKEIVKNFYDSKITLEEFFEIDRERRFAGRKYFTTFYDDIA